MEETETFILEATSLPEIAFGIFHELYQSKQLCDLIVKVDETKIPCHRVILSACIPYFRSMFSSEMVEAQLKTVIIKAVEKDAVVSLIEFVYSNKLSVDVNNVQNLLTAATIFQMDIVVNACCEFMEKHLHPTNCLGVRSFAELHGCLDLVEKADNFSRKNFSCVVQCEEFNHISSDHLIEMISSDKLCVRSEEVVFESIITWVIFDKDTRKKHLPKLLLQVRLPLLSIDYLINKVEKHELINGSLACRDLIDEAKNFHLCPEHVRTFRTLPRKSTAGVLFSVGGRGTSGEPFSSVECYDWVENHWFLVHTMLCRRRHVGVAVVGSKVFAIGGHDGKDHLNSMECFNPKTNQWTELTPMRTKRRGMSVGVVEGVIYVGGGLDETTCFEIVERYDPSSDEWSYVAPMSTQRGGVALAGLGGILYAVGGNDGEVSLSSVEKYNPHTDKWTPVASMNRRRAGVGVAILDGCLYAIGGFDESSPLDSVEKFDPSTQQWTYVASMSTSRGGVGACGMGGRVWAIGGHDGLAYLSSVELYNPLTDTWESVCNMNTHRAGAGVVACFCHLDDLQVFSCPEEVRTMTSSVSTAL